MRRKQKSESKQKPLTKQQHIKHQLSSIQAKIIKKLQNNELSIHRPKVNDDKLQQIPFLKEENDKEKKEKEFAKIMKEKKKIMDKLKFLELEEKQYTERRRITERNQKHELPERSEISDEDKKMLMKLRKRMMNYQKSVDRSYKQRQQIQLKLLRQQQQTKVNQRNEKNRQKKIQITQKLSQLKESALKRSIVKKLTDHAVKQQYHKKRLYNIWKQNWKDQHNEEEKKKYEIMEKRNKQKYVDFVGLKQHEKRYEEIIKEKKKQLEEKRLSLSRVSENSNVSLFSSKFHTILMEEQRDQKQQEEKKKQRQKMLRQKKVQYSQQVKKEFAPKIKNIETDQIVEIKNVMSQLTGEEIKKIGNSYLAEGNKRIKKIDANQTNEIISNFSKSVDLPRHRDYLTETRIKREKENKFNGIDKDLKREADRIMEDRNIQEKDKIAMLKLMATKFDSSNADIVTKIQGKLQILRAIN